MSTLVENVEKVKSAHAALSASIEAKGVSVPAGTKLTGMPALVDQIETGGSVEPTNDRAVFTYDTATSLVVPKMLVVDMASATNLEKCFYKCESLKSLTLQAGFGQNATDLNDCFSYCKALTSLTLPAGFGQNATNLNSCFAVSQSLTSLTLPAGFGQNATDIYYSFYNCYNIKSLHLPTGFGQASTDNGMAFYYCTELTTITGNPNFKVNVDFSSCKNLTHDSIMVVINGLQTVTET